MGAAEAGQLELERNRHDEWNNLGTNQSGVDCESKRLWHRAIKESMDY